MPAADHQPALVGEPGDLIYEEPGDGKVLGDGEVAGRGGGVGGDE